ncbi:protein-L-isoaspartate O-methyltransferase [Sphingomonas lutea]|uniref:Protein-L-isoaspartate O-methyltransferase n=1 Tax=Sphingomonas lutea TaxID=1045317 RepID=A0A7G9SGT0_9SPHN|nr:protein-L-isoaspartate O-methyltransferase [Sphingomonas lutea]QNN67055.1 protein-L-isoaspartate O-methyltransferase [Sphingomonas lutea]
MTAQSPIPDFGAARRAMIDNQLRPQGVTDRGVIDAMGSIERENFLPSHSRPLAYVDRAVTIGNGRFLSAPAAFAQLLQGLMPVKGERALVIGAGTGYAAAILGAMGVDVTAVESDDELAAHAKDAGIDVVSGPLDAGHAAGAPYDLILIDGAVPHIPEAIVQQLAEGGRLGTALIDRGITRLIVGLKSGGSFGHRSIGDAGVPPLPGFAQAKAFTF